jgi:predicted nuclease of restriction endonuclease-like (RecB) superfamily
MNSLYSDPNLLNQFKELKSRLEKAQYQALQKVNVEQLSAYFDIGKTISDNLKANKWGSGVIIQLAEYFKTELLGIRGLNQRNLYYMKSFYERYQDFTILQEAPAKLTWTHHQIILDATKTLDEALFYVHLAINKKYSSVDLKQAVKRNELENYNKSQNNFDITYKQISNEEHLIVGDEVNLDFLSLPKNHKEKQLEDGIVKNIVKFLSRMGGKMAFVGRQYPVKYTEREYFIDLLFYHIDLNCYVVFELKATRFEAEFVGKLGLYVGAVNKELKKESQNPTIGILICTDKDRTEVEYILSTMNAPIGVATYSYDELPVDIAKLLPSEEELAMDLKPSEEDGKNQED